MTIGDSWEQFDQQFDFPYDTRELPSEIPDQTAFSFPRRAMLLNKQWLAHLNGVIERLAWPDAWSGTDEEKQAAANSAIDILDQLQSGADVLYPIPYQWPSEWETSPASFLTMHQAAFDVPNNWYYQVYFSGQEYRVWLKIPDRLLITRIEIDSSWIAVAPGTTFYWAIVANGVTQIQNNTASSGTTTFIWQPSGTTILEQIRNNHSWDLFQRISVTNSGLPYYIHWSGVRVFGYYLPTMP